MKVIWNSLFIMTILVIASLPVTSQTGPPASIVSDQAFYGFNWGAAGIATVLLELITLSELEQDYRDQARELALSALDAVWDNRLLYNGEQIPAWTKFGGSEIYPGKKYGAAGIIDAFITAYNITGSNLYLDRAVASLDELYAEAANPETQPHWAYSFIDIRGTFGTSITDWNFGSVGMIDSALNVYRVTGNQTHLNYALRAMHWLENIAYDEEINSVDGFILPWYASDDRLNITFTSYYRGNTAAIKVFQDLGQLSGNSTYTSYAHFLTNWLISVQQQNGGWSDNPISENENTGLESGVPGVLLGLIESSLQSTAKSEAIQKGFEWLSTQLVSNRTHFFYKSNPASQAGYYSIFEGLAGIAKVMRLSVSEPEALDRIYTWILDEVLVEYTIAGTSLVGMFTDTSNSERTDHSFTNGLAGVIGEILKGRNDGLLEVDLGLFELYIDTMSFYQKDSGLWSKEVDMRIRNVVATIRLIVIVVGLLIVISYVRERSRR